MPDVYNSPKKSKSTELTGKKSHSSQKKKKRSVDDYSEIMKREKPSKRNLKSFLPKPIKTAFGTQTGGEDIILLLRRHPIVLFKNFLIIGVAIILPLLSQQSFLSDFLPAQYLIAINLSWYMLIFSYGVATFLIWFFSVYIITDERIIDVDFVSLLFKSVSAAKIDVIQDVSSKTSGFLASVVDYGTVYIQTASDQREIEFDDVPQPAKVASLLNELMLEEEREKIEGRVR